MTVTELLHIEKLHRFVFDTLYVKSKKMYSLDEQSLKNEYDMLFDKCPTWRQELINEYLTTNSPEIESVLKIDTKRKNICRYGLLKLTK